LHAGRLAQAIELYRAVLADDALSIEALMCLGIALHKDGQIDAAAHSLRGALFLEGDLWPAAFYLALCQERLGNPVEAAREYRRVVECAAKPMSMRAAILGDIETWKSEVVAVARDYLSRLGTR
jgi:tetratricopeptide (TPR) repeat protein